MEEYSYEEIANFESTNWWYQARRDLLFKILKKTGRRFSSVLDIGCGVGSHCAVLKQFGDSVIGVDPSEAAISYSADKGYDRLVQASVEQLPFPDASFELMLCADVLEHVDDVAAMKEITRLLAPNGILYITVPAHPCLWNRNDIYGHHLRRYSRKNFKDLIDGSLKIDVDWLKFWNFSLFFPLWLFTYYEKYMKDNEHKLENNLKTIPNMMNRLLLNIMRVENALFVSVGLPVGVSLIMIGHKTEVELI